MNNFAANIFKFFDRLEDKIRARLSRRPLLYALLGGIGVVLFWRGVWTLADQLFISPIVSIIIGGTILLMTGAFVSVMIGSRLIISGLSGEKKLAEKTKEEIKTEESEIGDIKAALERVEEKISQMSSRVKQ